LSKFKASFRLFGFEIPEDCTKTPDIAVVDMSKDMDDESSAKEMENVLKKIVPYLKIWSYTKIDQVLKHFQRGLMEDLRPVFAARQEWKTQKFEEIVAAEEFLQNLKMQKADTIGLLTMQADIPIWNFDIDTMNFWDSAFKDKTLPLSTRQQIVEVLFLNRYKSLMVEHIDEPFQRTITEWSALFSKNLHVEQSLSEDQKQKVDFSRIPKLPLSLQESVIELTNKAVARLIQNESLQNITYRLRFDSKRT
jgi:transcriptional regulator with GAF, ATPase, and Fis domain